MGHDAVVETYKCMQSIYSWQQVPAEHTTTPTQTVIPIAHPVTTIDNPSYVFDD